MSLQGLPSVTTCKFTDSWHGLIIKASVYESALPRGDATNTGVDLMSHWTAPYNVKLELQGLQ